MIDGHTPLPEPGTTRVRFAVVNLPIKRDLRCGPFLLSPVEDVDKIVKRLKLFTAPSTITAVGTYSLPNPLPEDPWPEVNRAIQTMDRLLTFAHRCRVHVVRRTREEWNSGQWVSRDSPIHFFSEGHHRPRPWYFRQDALEGFLARNFPKLVDAEYAESTGLGLALAFYDEVFSDYVTELRYLKTWLGFEILYSRNQDASGLMPRSGFKKVRQLLDQALKQAVQDDLLGEAERESIREKLGELNRLSAVRQSLRFLDKTFEGYPSQDVTEDEMRAFVKVRNDIVHRGEMQPETHRSLNGDGDRELDDEDYARDLARQQRRLLALFERVVLAMLGEHPRLMDVSWRESKTSR